VCYRESNDQLLSMHLDAHNVGFNQAAVVHCGRRFEVLADRSDDDCLKRSGRYTTDCPGSFDLAIEQCGRE
jgi:hypothetical protein